MARVLGNDSRGSVQNFFSRISPLEITILAAVLFIGSGVIWWNRVYTNPQRVFTGMLENSLRTNGVSRHVVQTGNGQDLNEISQLSIGASQTAQSLTTLTQGSDASTVVQTETIGTPTRDYTRYTSIQTDQKSTSGQSLDFSKVLGVWGDNENDSDKTVTNGELYNESTLGIVPFGNLSAKSRSQLLKSIADNNVYEVDYSKVARQRHGLRQVYVYTVNVDASKYVQVLKDFAKASGLNHLESLDPANYTGSDKLNFTLSVDVLSRQLTRIVYADGSRTEDLSGYNAIKNVNLPTDTITIDELQSRLQQIQ